MSRTASDQLRVKVSFGDVVQLSKTKSKNPDADGIDRYVGLDHLKPRDLKIRDWGNTTDGTTFSNVFTPGQVLFGKRRVYQRKVAIADFRGVCSSDIYVLEPKGSSIISELIPYICQSKSFFDYVMSMSQGGLSPRVNWNALAKYEFSLPPLKQQQRAARVLQAAEKVKLTLHTLKTRIESISDPLSTRSIWQGAPPTGSGLLSDGIAMPQEWNLGRLGDVVTFHGGSQPPQSTFVFKPTPGYVRLLQIRDYKSDENLTFIPEEGARKRCKADDIMIGRYGPPLFQILRGLEGAYNVALIKAEPDESVIDREYLYHFLRQSRLHDLIDHMSTRSAGQAGIEMDVLKRYPVPLPPLDVQTQIVQPFEALDLLANALDQRIEGLGSVLERIIQDLDGGE